MGLTLFSADSDPDSVADNILGFVIFPVDIQDFDRAGTFG